MNSLISLDLDFNELGDNLEEGRLRGLNTLQELHLRGNGMTKPPKEALADLRSVRVLSLDYNNLTKLGRLMREFKVYNHSDIRLSNSRSNLKFLKFTNFHEPVN